MAIIIWGNQYLKLKTFILSLFPVLSLFNNNYIVYNQKLRITKANCGSPHGLNINFTRSRTTVTKWSCSNSSFRKELVLLEMKSNFSGGISIRLFAMVSRG